MYGVLRRESLTMSHTATLPPQAMPSMTAGWKQFTRLLRPGPPRLNLALQGGGAHGAFTWGVLDALLRQPDLAFEGISGSSAGAMNAVVFADGWVKGGREGARLALAEFWNEVGRQMPWGPMTRGENDAINLPQTTQLLAHWAAYFSPSQLNPFDLNPLRDLLKRQVDFAGLRKHCPFKLFIGATQANTGKLRLFRESELTLEMLLASACLPKIHHSVEIDGEPYWDGGYSANPAVFPLFYECESRDVMLVLLNPLRRDDTPHTAHEIDTRIAELGFSAHFMREMRMFAQARTFADRPFLRWGRLERRLHTMRFHMLDSSGLVNLERSDTKLLAHGPFLELLREQGHTRCKAWLAHNVSAIGQHATLDVEDSFA
jgi:NTE family protein